MGLKSYCAACGKPTNEYKTDTAWGKLGYCSTDCLKWDSDWLLDPEVRREMPCACPSPAHHHPGCSWFQASRRKDILVQLGYNQENVRH